MSLLNILYLKYKLLKKRFLQAVYIILGLIKFKLSDVEATGIVFVNGPIDVTIHKKGKLHFGKNCKINNQRIFNPIGREQKTLFDIYGVVLIGNNVGMSSVAFVCYKKITIGNNVKIGGSVVFYDTDFHSLNSEARLNRNTDIPVSREITIKDNVFIGAHSTILKGVTIGENSIIGACSVITKDIPSNQIWGGNPAKFIRKI